MRIYRKLFLLSILFIPSCWGEETTDTTVEDAATRNFDTDIVLSEGLNIQDEAIVTINSGVTVTNTGTTGIKNGIYDGYIYGSSYLGKDIDVQVGGTLKGGGTISGYVIRHHEGKAPEWTSGNETNYYNISLANITKRGNISADLTLTDATNKFFEVIDAGQTDSLARMYRNVDYYGSDYNQDEDETKTKITTINGVVPQINLCDITSNVDTFKEELKTTLETIVNDDGSTIIFQDYGLKEGQYVGQIALQYWTDLRFVYPASTFKIDLSGDWGAGKNYILDTISYYKQNLQYNDFGSLTSDGDIYNFVDNIVTSYETYVDSSKTLPDETKQEYEDTYNTTWETLTERMNNYTSYKKAYEDGDFDTLDDTVKANVVTYYVQALDAVWLKTIDSTLPYQSNLQAKKDSYEAQNSQILKIAGISKSDDGSILVDNTASWESTKIVEVIGEETSGYEMIIADINELNTYYNNLKEMNEHLKKLIGEIGEDSTSCFVAQFEQNDALIDVLKRYFSDKSTAPDESTASDKGTALRNMYTNYNKLLEIEIDANSTWDNDQIQSHINEYIKNYISDLEDTKNIYSGLLNTFQSYDQPTEPAIDGILRNDNTDGSAIKTLAIKTSDNRSLYLGGGIKFEMNSASLVLGNDEIASGATIKYEDLSKGDSGADNANVVIAKDATFTGVTDIDLYPALALAQKTSLGADGLTSGTDEVMPESEVYARSGSTLIFQEGDAIETEGNWTFRDNSRLISKRKIIVTAGTCITFGEPYASTITLYEESGESIQI